MIGHVFLGSRQGGTRQSIVACKRHARAELGTEAGSPIMRPSIDERPWMTLWSTLQHIVDADMTLNPRPLNMTLDATSLTTSKSLYAGDWTFPVRAQGFEARRW